MSDHPLAPPTDDDLLPETEPIRRRTPGGVVLAAVSIVALLGGALFAVVYLRPDANTPEDAVREMIGALTDEDVLGALDALAPAERDLLRDTVVDVVDELRRLEVLDDDADLSGIDGVDFEVDDLRLASRPLGDGVTAVSVAGSVHFRADPEELPIGAFVKEQTEEGGLGPAVDERAPIEDVTIVVIEDDGRWYVSLLYTLAESIRADSGEPVPDFGNGVAADGAASPEAAVRALLDAGGDLDARRAISLLPPDEAAALQDYAPLFLDDVEEAAADARDTFRLEVDTFDVAVDRDGDEAEVTVERIAVELTVDGERSAFDFDGECLTVEADGEEDRTCGGAAGLAGSFALPFAAGLDAEPEDIDPVRLSIVTVRRDGKWYVSPMRTVLRPLVEQLRHLDREDLDALVDGFSSGASSSEVITESGSATSGDGFGSDRAVQGELRNALTAFKVAFTDTGAWPTHTDELSAIEPSLSFVPYGGFVFPTAVAYEVEGDILRLVARGAAGCWYLADDQRGVRYGFDARCGPPAGQAYGPSW